MKVRDGPFLRRSLKFFITHIHTHEIFIRRAFSGEFGHLRVTSRRNIKSIRKLVDGEARIEKISPIDDDFSEVIHDT